MSGSQAEEQLRVVLDALSEARLSNISLAEENRVLKADNERLSRHCH